MNKQEIFLDDSGDLSFIMGTCTVQTTLSLFDTKCLILLRKLYKNSMFYVKDDVDQIVHYNF